MLSSTIRVCWGDKVLDRNNLNKGWFYWSSHIHICNMPQPYYIDLVISIHGDFSLQTFSRNTDYTSTSAHRPWMVMWWFGTPQGQARRLRTQGFFLLKLNVALSELAVLFFLSSALHPGEVLCLMTLAFNPPSSSEWYTAGKNNPGHRSSWLWPLSSCDYLCECTIAIK